MVKDEAVGIYGGFIGTETQRDQRDWQTNVTSIGALPIPCFVLTADAIFDGVRIFNC